MPKPGYSALTFKSGYERLMRSLYEKLSGLSVDQTVALTKLVEEGTPGQTVLALRSLPLVKLQETAVSIVLEDKLVNLWNRLQYIKQSLPGFYLLRDSLLRDGVKLPRLGELTKLVPVEEKVYRLLASTYPKWYEHPREAAPAPYTFHEGMFLPHSVSKMTPLEPLSAKQVEFYRMQEEAIDRASREWSLVMKRSEFEKTLKEFVKALGECFDLAKGISSVVGGDTPLVKALYEIISPLEELRNSIDVRSAAEGASDDQPRRR